MSMTMQQIFDKVALHLLQQNAQSVSTREGFCAYRGAAGRKCAVGFLILDEHYETKLEGLLAPHPHVQHALARSGVISLRESQSDYVKKANLLSLLQEIHDRMSPTHWPRALLEVAHFQGLKMPALASQCMPQDEPCANEAPTEEREMVEFPRADLVV